MISILKITKGDNSAKNVGGATVVNVCTSSVMLYISTYILHVVWSCFIFVPTFMKLS